MNKYTYDVKMFASITVSANSKKEAREKIKTLDGALANLGAIDGEPVLCELSHDGEHELIEVNGEAV